MDHWVTTEEIKVASGKARRDEARALEGQGKLEAKPEGDTVAS